MWCLLLCSLCSWHLVNGKTKEVCAQSPMPRHLNQYGLPDQTALSALELSSMCCCHRELQHLRCFKAIRKYWASSENSDCLYPCISLDILARVLDILFTCTWSHVTSESVSVSSAIAWASAHSCTYSHRRKHLDPTTPREPFQYHLWVFWDYRWTVIFNRVPSSQATVSEILPVAALAGPLLYSTLLISALTCPLFPRAISQVWTFLPYDLLANLGNVQGNCSNNPPNLKSNVNCMLQPHEACSLWRGEIWRSRKEQTLMRCPFMHQGGTDTRG